MWPRPSTTEWAGSWVRNWRSGLSLGRSICFSLHSQIEMDQRLNPYTPGSGVKPLKLAGRDSDLEAFRAGATPDLFSLRGAGKTRRRAAAAESRLEQYVDQLCNRAEPNNNYTNRRGHPHSACSSALLSKQCLGSPLNLLNASNELLGF
jgi:hypothetical protein